MKTVTWILVGGFLGAGKTTLLARAARRLLDGGKRVGLVTNDQASGLADTELLRHQGLQVDEVAGGCFCCRFDDLMSATDRLLKDLDPDVLLGEPVGSCTDISATVLQPFKDLYADWFRLAPFTVLAEPSRLREALAPGGRPALPESVLYIFRKQLEEADAIVLNKTDSIGEAELRRLKEAVAEKFPETPVLTMSALKGDGVDAWLDFVMQDRAGGKRLTDVDYDTYAEGEALLGWINASVRLDAGDGADWANLLETFLRQVRETLRSQGAEIAHVKLLLTAADGSISANLVSTTAEPSVWGDVEAKAGDASLVVNARVHAAPEVLRQTIESCLQDTFGRTAEVEITATRSFRPDRPRPTHRYGSVV